MAQPGAPREQLRPTLPRDTPLWLEVSTDSTAFTRPAAEHLPEGASKPVQKHVLALSCLDGAILDLYDREADRILGAATPFVYIHDSGWELFPEIGAALRRIASKEECTVAAFCKERGLWAFGVSMSAKNRMKTARVALLITALGMDTSSAASLGDRLQGLAARAREDHPENRNRSSALSVFLRVRFWPISTAAAGLGSRIRRLLCPPRSLRITSPCDGAAVHWADRRKDREGNICWDGFCVCCKRPLTMTEADRPLPPKAKRQKTDRCAYVCTLWGRDPQHILGAMVLGYSLRRAGTKHDLVILYASDVPQDAVAFLRRVGWHPYPVDYVFASERLFSNPRNRFAGVFTKLRALSLIEYSKVILLDSDLLVLQNIDDLFQLAPPAAMHRGIACGYQHGDRIDGRHFFGGSRPGFDSHSWYWSSEEGQKEVVRGPWSWGQGGGINAGVMLLKPDLETLDQCLSEVADGMHPEHIQGSGPEQDYLSRFFAQEWSHIGVEYNFQIHQLYFMLGCADASDEYSADRKKFLQQPGMVKVFHYSSDPKPWARKLDVDVAQLSEKEWLHDILGRMAGYRQWVLKDPEYVETGDPEAPRWAIEAAENLTSRALRLWDEAYQELARELDEPTLAQAVVDRTLLSNGAAHGQDALPPEVTS